MNSHQIARQGYAGVAQATRSPRAIEYEVFARITHRLRAASEPGSGLFARLAEALHENRSLWKTLALDLADDGNGLPVSLRARLLSLAGFTEVHTSKVLAGTAAPDVLIDINTAIMRGLRQQGSAG